MSKSPFGSVKERFESKEKLVAAVQKLATKELWLDRVNGTKGLEKVSNAKLLRLHDVLTRAKDGFGSRDKLITAIAELAKRSKDKGYASRLETYPLPRLLDLHDSLSKSGAKASAKAKTAKPRAVAQRVVRTKKAKAKAAA